MQNKLSLLFHLIARHNHPCEPLKQLIVVPKLKCMKAIYFTRCKLEKGPNQCLNHNSENEVKLHPTIVDSWYRGLEMLSL